MKKIIVTDDHKIFADLIEENLIKNGYQVIGNFQLGSDLINEPELENADYLILDLSLPDMNGKEIVNEIKEKGIKSNIIILTSNSNPSILLELYQLGINGFVHKSKDLNTLIEAIESIEKGQDYFSDINFIDIINAEKEEIEDNIELSPRELEIAELLAEQKSNQEVAEALFISINTVKAHKKSLYKKLNVSSSFEFRSEALRRNII